MTRFRMSTHPVELDMYYSLLTAGPGWTAVTDAVPSLYCTTR